MSPLNRKIIFGGGTIALIVLTITIWNAPVGVFRNPITTLGDLIRDRKVVDVLYLSEKAASDGEVVDKSFPSKAKAAVAANSARTFYGVTNNAGRLMWATGASNSTGAEIAGPVGTASNAGFVRAYHAPTRDEILAGVMKADGSLAVSKIVGGQDAAGDSSLEFDQATVTSAQTCDGTTFGSCWRAFDIAYEQLSGEAMVAFSTSTTGRLSYRTWNGTSWTPATTTTASSMVTGGSGAVRWVRLIPRGEGMKGTRSDEILMIASDANSDIFAGIWNGSAWTATTTITTTASTFHVQNFDGAWEETTGNALVVWSEGTAASTAPYRYKRWTRSNTTWDASGTSLPTVALSSIGHWVSLKSAPIAGKDHIAIIGNSATTVGNNCSTATNCRAQPYIWTGGASPTMTIGNQWASLEPVWAPITNVAVESLNSVVNALYVGATGATSDTSAWQTWIEGTGFSAITDITGAMGDDATSMQITAHPNSNDIFITGEDIDSDCNGTYWNGSAIGVTWDTAACNSAGELLLAPRDTGTGSQPDEGQTFWVAPVPYSPWSRNWRFYGDYTENDPDNATDSLNAAENQTASVSQESFMRLRFQFAELSGLAQTDARKKLQWTTSTPDSATSVWTDVGDTSETTAVWRYATAAETCTNCSDNTAIGAQRLTGSTQSGAYLSDKDLAAGTNMDHTALALAEYDYPLKAEDAVAGTTYYFRAYDNDQLTPVFREQDADGSNDCSSAVCAYPSVTVAAPVITVSSTGTQTSPMSVSTAGNYLGGAFTFVRSAGSANVTQIVVSEQGTVNANANLANFRLWYETAGTCTYTGTSTLTAFNSSGTSFGGTDKATVTGTMSVGTSQVCVYALVDVGAATPTETIDIEISNPSTEVTASAGTVTPASTVTITGTTTLQAASTVSCSTNIASTSFGSLTTSAVTTASPNASTTASCTYAGGCTLSVQDAGNGASPGLATTTPAYLIPSATATLSPGTEGYGIQAVTTAVGSGAVLVVSSVYDKTGNDVGGLTIANMTLASSTSAFSNREILVTHKAAIGILTNAGNYTDTITYSCTGNP